MLDSGRPAWLDVSAGASGLGEAVLVGVVLSVVKQRLDAVRAVLAGVTVTEVAAATKATRRLS